MSWTNILSAGTGVPSAEASDPTGLATAKVPHCTHLCCHACSISLANRAVYRCWGVSAVEAAPVGVRVTQPG